MCDCRGVGWGRYSGEGMYDTRAAHDQQDSRTAGEIPVCARGVRGGLFVAEADEADASCDAGLGDLDDGDADDAKDNRDAQRAESLRNQLSA